MKRFLLFILGSVLANGAVSAKVYDRLVLKDGSILEGYITAQHLGKDIVFKAERSVICLKESRVYSIDEFDMELSRLSSAWQQWAEKNPTAVKYVNGVQYLTLSQIRLKSDEADSIAVVENVDVDSVAAGVVEGVDLPLRAVQSLSLVRVVERGAVVKYIDVLASDYVVKVSEATELLRKPRSADMMTGLDDVVETRSGKVYEGQVIAQLLGKSIRLITTDGVVQVIDMRDIALQRKQPINVEQDKFEQVPFLDVVTTADQEYRGIITLQNYGSVKEPAYLCLLEKNGRESRINMGSVKELRRVVNTQYNPIKKLQVGEGEYYFAQQLVKAIPVQQDKRTKTLYLNNADTEDHVVLSAAKINKRLVIEMQNTPENRLAILLPIGVKTIGKVPCCAFTYEELLTSAIPATSVMTVNNGQILRKEYDVYMGNYILYHPNTKTVNFCEIK